jgi:hypothetical protein
MKENEIATVHDTERLLPRLEAIGQSLASSGSGVALIALGSVGLDTARIDAYSDLDFFAIVRPGSKAAFMSDLNWLSRPHPIAYAFQNTVDGYKALYEDGIFAEFAVFEPHELDAIPFAPGRVVWAAQGVDLSIGAPRLPLPNPGRHSVAWLVGEALTNLYVGLGRFRRGEKRSAMQLIQGFAVERFIELVHILEPRPDQAQDPFAADRRFEIRYPNLAPELARCMQGYDASPQSARHLLALIEQRTPVNKAIQAKILALIETAG